MNQSRSPQPEPRKLRGRLLVSVLALGCLLGGASVGRAYDNDTHYALTYYLAVKMGYTETEAHKIASANISVDYDPKTEPFGGSKVRADNHAFEDTFLRAIDPWTAREYIRQRQDQLWKKAMETGNPGVLLHFVQDKYSHDGFRSVLGQLWFREGGKQTAALSDSLMTRIKALGLSHILHETDFLSADVNRAARMVEETKDVLRKFLKEKLGRDPRDIDSAELDALMSKLIEASPPSKFFAPDFGKAMAIVGKALDRYVPDWRQFEVNKDGTLEDGARITYDDSKPKPAAYFDYPSKYKQPLRKPTPTVVATPTAPTVITPSVITPSVSVPTTRTPAPVVTPRFTPTPLPVYRTSGGGVTTPSVPFPTYTPSTPGLPTIPSMPTLGYVGMPTTPGKGTGGYTIGFDDSMPKTSPKGVSMRIGIDRGTLTRMDAPPALVSKIRAAE